MITNTETFNQIISLQKEIIDQVFDIKGSTLYVEAFKSEDWVNFENCTFNCDQLVFQNIQKPKLTLEFKNCTFNCSVSFSNCTFDTLEFRNTKVLESLEIHKGLYEKCISQLNVLDFSNDSGIEKPQLSTKFSIRKTNIGRIFFQEINHVNGDFQFLGNTVGEKNDNISSFQNSIFSNVLFGKNSFLSFTTFKRAKFNATPEYSKPDGSAYEFPGFYKNTFSKVSFSRSNFIDTFQFDNCDFLSTTWFENCKNLDNSELKFVACEFKGFSLFNKSKINFLDIDRCTFDKSSSFTDAEFNTLKLFEVKFGGGAYFDEMKINKVLDKSYLKAKNEKILEWKRTLRAIKQELQKTENKIDFNRFRSYELAAHYKELSLWRNFKDTSILWSTKWTTDFGLSWTRAFWFTILSGLFWYSILYRIENSGVFNSEKVNEFFVGAFRFFLVTDFYNPLETDRVYLTNPLSWFVFILGKIVIAFGIYEMIQSFRKFKA